MASLLLTSKTMHSLVLASCKGVTTLYYHGVQQHVISVPTLTAWIAKYGQLLGTLSFEHEFEPTVVGDQERAAAGQALAASLQQAAISNNHPLAGITSSGTSGSGGRSGLQLHTCYLRSAGVDAVAVLQQLPGCSLTLLNLCLMQPLSCLSDRNHNDYLRCFSNSLTHLTNLRDLQLEFSSHPNTNASLASMVDPILQQLSGLTNLRALALSWVPPANTTLQLLPTFLKELTLSWECDAGPSQLHMTHLTALTRLTCSNLSRLPMDLLLPPSLVTLCAPNLMHSSCLRPLKALQKVDLCQYQGGDDNLQHMSVLTSLTHVQVAFRSLKSVDLSSCAWRIMPVKRLEIIGHGGIAQQTVHHLGHLTQLTFLQLECPIDSSPAAFAAVLQRMAQLEILILECKRPQAGSKFFGQLTDDKSSAIHVFMALTSLHYLVNLRLQGLNIDYEAARLAAALPTGQLKHLALVDCSLDNSTLTAILTAMPLANVETLDIDKNQHVDDAVLSFVAGLLKLRQLDCKYTSITPSGCLGLLPHVKHHSGGGDGQRWTIYNGVLKYWPGFSL